MVAVGDRLSGPDGSVWTVVAADDAQGLYVLERQKTVTTVAERGEIGTHGRRYRPLSTEVPA